MPSARRRRRRLAWALTGKLLAVTPAHAEPVEYLLDPTHTFFHAEVRHFGTSTIRARFGAVAGRVLLDRDQGRGRLAVAKATATVSTGVRVFDSRLRDADLLDSAAFAQATFVADDFRFDAGRLVEVRGEFTLRGVRQPLTLRALRFACEWRVLVQREVCGGDFEAHTERSAYGAVLALPFVRRPGEDRDPG